MQRVLLKQADGHSTVAFRRSATEQHSLMLSNGTVASVVAREGEFIKIVTKTGDVGFVKARNAKLIVAPTATAAPKATPKRAPLAVEVQQKVPSDKAATKQIVYEDQPTAQATAVCTFNVNGTQYTVDTSKVDMDPELSVHDWMAANVPNVGVRRSCGVGHCGACVSMLTYADTTTGKTTSRSFNACIRPILACNGMSITTSRGIGSERNPNVVQSTLANLGGSQCGFCSVGMIMNLYAKLADAPDGLTAAELDSSLDGNLCRCTGYRPIAEAYKTFAKDQPSAVTPPPEGKYTHLKKTPQQKAVAVHPSLPKTKGNLKAGTRAPWYEVTTEAELATTLQALQKQNPQPNDIFLVAGHTTKGIYTTRQPDALVSIHAISTLAACSVTSNGVAIGSATTMTDAIKFLEGVVTSQDAVKVTAFKRMAEHAHISPGNNIRNTGTIGGNVMMMYEHQTDGASFPTEWPVLLQTAGATLTIVDTTAQTQTDYSMEDFWSIPSMKFKYIQSIKVPFSSAGDFFMTYRCAQRNVFAESYLTSGMATNVQNGKITPGSTRLVFSNIDTKPIRVTTIESRMDNMAVNDEAAMVSLCTDIQTTVKPQGDFGDVAYRTALTGSFLYKFFLALQPTLPASLQSAAQPWLPKAPTTGSQKYQADPSVAPLSMPVPKIDAIKQCTGEAEYVQNIPASRGTLHGAAVIGSAIGQFTISDEGVADSVATYQGMVVASDLPPSQTMLASGSTSFIGQPIAIALAGTPQDAANAAAAITITVANPKTSPIITIPEAIAAGNINSTKKLSCGDPAGAFASCDKIIENQWNLGQQYHYHMETQSAMCEVSSDGIYTVHASTQMPTITGSSVSSVLGLAQSQVILKNKRCGGGFGGKLTNSVVTAQLAAAACYAKGVPVSLICELGTNMLSYGLRPPFLLNLKIGYNTDGTIQVVQIRGALDAGASAGDSDFTQQAFMGAFDNCYNIPNWDVQLQSVKTDLPANTSMRAPGWMPAVYTAERMITTVATDSGLDAMTIREKNFYQKNDVTPMGMKLTGWTITDLWQQTMASANFTSRLQSIKQFNANNRWVKKGIAMVPSKFNVGAGSTNSFDCSLIVNADGSVTVMTGGTEIGQGLTTKVVQTVAYNLNIPMGFITIAEQSTTVLKATDATGGSVGSELSCRAAKNACEKINQALATIKSQNPDASWAQWVAEAYSKKVSLNVMADCAGVPGGVDPAGDIYNTYGVGCLEATVDILTGQIMLDRADITYDLGRSVNPFVDIGQVEGAFVIGVGHATVEECQYYPNGSLQWYNYVIPTPWDTPAEMNVTLATETPNPYTVGGGKAIGEPAVTMTFVAIEAIEMALNAAQKDANATVVQSASVPLAIQQRFSLGAVSAADFKLQA
ncbi:Xanthine dehydrogenase [Diplonema papillatum]|nr:Xanthine dehydrogenase [Diplonema papillatum]